MTCVVASLAVVVPAFDSPASATSTTWSQSITLQAGTALCGTFQNVALPATTTSITSLAVSGGGGGSGAGQSGGSVSGAGGFGGKVTATTVTLPSPVPGFLNAEVGCGGGAGGQSTTATAAGGAGGVGWGAGGTGGAASGSGGSRLAGGGGGGGSALCFGTTTTTNCGAGTGTATPIAIASGGGGGGAISTSGSHDGGGGGNGATTAASGDTNGNVGSASTGGAAKELYVASGAAGQGFGGGGGAAGRDAGGGGGGGGTGAAGADGPDGGTPGTAGANASGGVGTAGGAGAATGNASNCTGAAAGGTTSATSGAAGGTGGSDTHASSSIIVDGGGGGGGGYTGGGGGACDDSQIHGSTSVSSAGGGAGAMWVHNTYIAGPTFANANTTRNGATSGNATTCTASASNVGAGGTGVTSTAGGDAGCAGAITFTITGTAVSATAPTPTVTAGSASVNIPVTYNAGTPFSSFAISSWAVSCAAGGTLTASGSGVGANQTATITGTAPTVAGSTSCTLTANSSDSVNNGANAYQNQTPFTLVVNPGAPTHIAFTPAAPGPGTAGSAIPSTAVSVLDQFNNLVTTQNSGTIGMTINSGPQSSFTSGTTSVTVASGVANFNNLVVNKAGSYVLTATPTSISGATSAVNSTSFTVSPGPENKLVVTAQPSSPISAGGTVSLQVTIQDAFTNTITTGNTGSTDTIAVALSSGSFAAGSTSVAAVNGVANFSGLQINSTAGSPYTINVTDSSHPSVTGTATNQVVVNPGSATKLAFVQQPSNVAAGANMSPAPTVQVQDAGGNPVSGSGVSITLTPSSGTIAAGATASTNAAGLATFSGLEINTAATGLTLSGASSGLTGTGASSTFNVTGGAATSVSFVQQPSNVTAGASMSPAPTVSVTDQFGNPVNGAGVTLGVSSGSISSGFSASTGANGIATFSALKINTAATGLTLTATSSAINSPASSPFNVTAAAANKLAFVQQPSVVTAGVVMTPAVTVQIQDQFGNSVASNNVQITLTPSVGPATGNVVNTDSTGLATFSSLTVNSAGNRTLTATSTGLTPIVSNGFTVNAGPANKLAFVQNPSNVTAGASMAPAVTVQVQDQFGNAVPTSGVSITLAPSAGVINSGAGTTTNGSGLATFSALQINNAATGLTLTASSTSPALTSGASTSFNVTAGTQSKLVFVQGPSNVVAGVSMAPSVTVQAQDTFGNPVSTSGTTITLVPSSGTINSGNTANTANGLATFGAVKINTAATGLTLTATGPSLTAAPASSAFNVTAAAATKLVFGQQPSNVVAGNAVTPAVTVQLQDQFSNNAPTSGVTITLTPSTGVINAGNSANTSVAGLATFSGITIDAAATGITITAASSGLTSTPASNAFNVTAAAASKLVFVQAPTDTNVGVAITPAVTVQVQDQFNNSVTGAGVNITLNPSIGTIDSGASANTAASGLATFSGVTINTAATGITLTATASGPLTSLASGPFNVSVLVTNGVTLTNTATDAGSGVDTVSYYYCAGFTGSCTNGTFIGSATAGPAYSVAWNGQPGNGPYRLVSVAVDHVTNTSAASASIPVTVLNQQSQTISFTSTPGAARTVGTTYTVTATASSGLTVTFSTDASSTGCSIAGATVTFTAVGTCVIDADQAGNSLYTPAPQVQQTMAVLAPLVVTGITSTNGTSIVPGTSTQTITFNNALNPASVPTSGTMTLSLACSLFTFSCPNPPGTTLNISGLTNGAIQTGTTGWVSKPSSLGTTTNTTTYNVTMTLGNGNKSITIAVSPTCVDCGNSTTGAAGTYKFIPAPSIVDLAGDSAPEADIASFRIF